MIDIILAVVSIMFSGRIIRPVGDIMLIIGTVVLSVWTLSIAMAQHELDARIKRLEQAAGWRLREEEKR